MADDKDPFDTFSSETMKRAEEMCAGLSSSLGLDRRGEASMFDGAVTNLEEHNAQARRIVVAEHGADTLVVISQRPLEACRRALLVYRRGPAEDAKLIGELEASREGQREEDRRSTAAEYFARFNTVKAAGGR